MAHVRQQIRERLAVELAGLTTTSTRVYQTRLYNIDETLLPCLLIYTQTETSEVQTLSRPYNIYKTLTIIVEGVARAVADIDDTLDTIAAEVETAVGNSTLNNLAKDFYLTSTSIDLSADAQQPTGTVRLTFNATYVTTSNAPETAL